jgi:hypothetical protein
VVGPAIWPIQRSSFPCDGLARGPSHEGFSQIFSHGTPRFPSYFTKVGSSDVIQYKTRLNTAVVKVRTSIANMGSKSRTNHLQDILWNITGKMKTNNIYVDRLTRSICVLKSSSRSSDSCAFLCLQVSFLCLQVSVCNQPWRWVIGALTSQQVAAFQSFPSLASSRNCFQCDALTFSIVRVHARRFCCIS